MANPLRGSVALQVGDRALTLSFSVNALVELEDKLDKSVTKIAASLNDPEGIRISTLRALVWAALRDHHQEVTLEEAGKLATEATVPVMMEAVGRAFKLAFPDSEAKEGKGPRKAAAA